MKSILQVKKVLGLVEMTSVLVNASFSLPEWQAIKMIFFATCASFISKSSTPYFSCKIAISHNASVLNTFYSE